MIICVLWVHILNIVNIRLLTGSHMIVILTNVKHKNPKNP